MSKTVVSRETRARLGWVDALKGFLILTVVYLHTYNGYQIEGTYVKGVIKWITSFHMAAFFACSGFFFNLTTSKDNITGALKKKAKVLLVPYVVWGIVIGFIFENGRVLIRGHEFDIVDTIIDILIARVSYLAAWFLWVLFGIYCIQHLLIAISGKNKRLIYIFIGANVLFLVAGYILNYFFEDTVFRFSQILVSCFFFMFGAMARRLIKALTETKLWIRLLVALITVAVGAVCGFLNSIVTYSLELYGNLILHTAGACFTTVGLMVFFALFYEWKGLGWLKRFLEFMGKNSLIVLLTHSLLLYGIRVLEMVLKMQIHSFPGLVSFAVVIVMQVILIKVIPKKLLWSFGK